MIVEKKYDSYLKNADAMSSKLLGSFNDDGEYVIDDKIKAELLKANKVITDYRQEKITATCNVGSNVFSFVVFIQLGQNNKKRAGMFLAEKGKLGFIEKDLFTTIGSYVGENDNTFLDKIKKEFHLYIKDESQGVDLSNSALKEILEKLNKDASRNKFLLSALIDEDKKYVLRMMAIVKADKACGSTFWEEFRTALAGLKIKKNDPKYWQSVKNLMDKHIQKNFDAFDEKTQNNIKIIQKNYAEIVKNTKEPPAKKDDKAKGKDKKKKKDGKKGGDKKGDKPKSKDGGKDNKSSSATKSEDKANNSNLKTTEEPEIKYEKFDYTSQFNDLSQKLHGEYDFLKNFDHNNTKTTRMPEEINEIQR